MEFKPILCKNCGWFKCAGIYDTDLSCPICNAQEEFIDLDMSLFIKMSDVEKEQFAIDYVGHDFDPELKAKRIEYERNRNARLHKIIEQNNAQHPECPYCHSHNTKKITNTSKVINTALFGIFGTKRHKQWHCNNCKSDF